MKHQEIIVNSAGKIVDEYFDGVVRDWIDGSGGASEDVNNITRKLLECGLSDSTVDLLLRNLGPHIQQN